MKMYTEGTCVVVEIPDDLQGPTIEELDDQLAGLAAQRCATVLVDFTQVQYLYSRGVGILIKYNRIFREQGATFAIVNVSRKTMDFINQFKLGLVLSIYQTREEFDFASQSTDAESNETAVAAGLRATVREEVAGSVVDLAGTCDSRADLRALSIVIGPLVFGKGRIVYINAVNLIYVDEDGVAMLEDFGAKAKAAGGVAALCGANEVVAERFSEIGKGSLGFFISVAEAQRLLQLKT
ncbi:MAG: hypothetical protein A2268_14455 [Candidatus Raymondbacteria bacterium RifOxyA12_full_50_37]|uniref:STAS domain-containing protein n=1 Tax=Candidatus Raymondbacteria bacterium RIFOXYD12_FULL_49_13 TaxID=1817890 RepID=A0A1F7F8Z4_UNCRA|nr:MAG: hypothetical protein A2268_14455 [Candidatus Raymondbacteria bacterium RifOxyA12_full_50_37]OGJ88622.1 MAG: hypothetical protein A2248_20390 [Candidatus Raymondbacteria bacterium RIFOXYA2_FULL_49_16]OGK02902.1 MAG: hypothetical protein A2487_17920 [Candidatus Raymondbacteria bacterium RifOxyC12_full_50_8]OGK02952.1 MAG: hypothetical protein A2350_20090 [Candidatus Raymondbacteria bacterium RifOxyB12_full_50_8]OGK03139.1 MAG: hypothetical protein A2519_06975 [Candidatus Raymondbacteria b